MTELVAWITPPANVLVEVEFIPLIAVGVVAFLVMQGRDSHHVAVRADLAEAPGSGSFRFPRQVDRPE